MYLNVHSYNSLCYGTMPIADLVAKAAASGYCVLPLTDINTTMGVMDFVFECKKLNVRPVAGCEFRNGNELLYVALAKDDRGYAELNAFLTQHNISKLPYPEQAPQWEHVFVIYPFGKRNPNLLRGNEFLGVRLSQLTKLFRCEYPDKLVMMQPFTFADENDFQLHQNLRALDKNVLLSRLKKEDCAAEDEFFLSSECLKTSYVLYPQLIENTQKLLDHCEINLNGEIKKRKCFTDNVFDDREMLRKLAFDGMFYRYGKSNKTAYRRIEKELEIIERMNFCAYFLMVWDVVRFALSQGFYHVGRGSGSNTVVAYCLKITDVDPIELDLDFEQFLNPKHISPPRFDLDFSWKERDVIIDYLFKKYGNDHVALLGATVTFQHNSLCRELGKVHGLPKSEIDLMERNPQTFAQSSDLARQILALSENLQDFPRQRSIQAGGVLITESPITDFAALDLSPKGFPTTQFDMCSAEKLGIETINVFSQKGIAHIRDAVEMIRQLRGINLDIHRIEVLKNDELVKRQLLKAETIGCFYIESPSMRCLLRKLHCSDYKALAAAEVFPKDSASYAAMSFQSFYLKSHFPLEFQVAVINNFGGFYQTWVYLNEAKRLGANIHLPCVNRSQYLTSLNGKTVFMGFVHLQGIDQKFVERFIAERETNGAFASLDDFVSRVPLELNQLVLLVRGGAFAFTKKTRTELLWMVNPNKSQTKLKPSATLSNVENQHFGFSDFKTNALKNAYDEIELYGFPVSMSWFDMLQTRFRGELMAVQMSNFVGRKFRMLGKLVTVKYDRTAKGDLMALGTFTDCNGEMFDTVHYANVLKTYSFQGDGMYLLYGKVVDDFGYPLLEVEKMAKMPYLQNPKAE